MQKENKITKTYTADCNNIPDYNNKVKHSNTAGKKSTKNDMGGSIVFSNNEKNLTSRSNSRYFGEDCEIISQISQKPNFMVNNTVFSEIRMEELNFSIMETGNCNADTINHKNGVVTGKLKPKEFSSDKKSFKKDKKSEKNDFDDSYALNQNSYLTNDIHFLEANSNTGNQNINYNLHTDNNLMHRKNMNYSSIGTKFLERSFMNTNINRSKLHSYHSITNNKNNNTSKTIQFIEKALTDFSDKVIEVKNHKNYTNFELSKMFFEIFHEAPPGSIILLPPRYISLPQLIIKHKLTIKGSPGTLIEISNGNIIINTDVVIAQCSFVFNLEIGNFIERFNFSDEILNSCVDYLDGKYSISLCTVVDNSKVEIADCDFRVIVHKNEELLDDEEHVNLIKETCFHIGNNSQFYLSSTICSNFYRIINTDNSASVVIEKCHFADNLFEAVAITNPLDVDINNCFISNCGTGVKIIIDTDLMVLDNRNIKLKDAEIKIIDNEITQNDYGVIIHSGFGSGYNNTNNVFTNRNSPVRNRNSNPNSNNLSKEIPKLNSVQNIEISANKIMQNKKIGVLVEKIKIMKNLIIMKNEISFNFDVGVFIKDINFEASVDGYNHNSTIDLENDSNNSNLKFIANTLNENKNNFASKMINMKNSLIFIEGCNITNNLSGVMFSGLGCGGGISVINIIKKNGDNNTNINNFSNISSGKSKLIIQNTTISDNLDSGAVFNNNTDLNTYIFKSKFLRCHSYGINLNGGTEDEISTNYNSMVMSNSNNSSHLGIGSGNTTTAINNSVYLSHCDILNNKSAGIYLKNYLLNIDFCKIIDNNRWAVEIPLERNKNLLKLTNYENGSLNTMISNPIGGSWGMISNKKAICSSNKGSCFIL